MSPRLVLFASIFAAGLPALASILAHEKTLLTACRADGNDLERCRCYLGVIKGETGEEEYERALALAAAGVEGDPRLMVETLRRFGMSAEDQKDLARRLQLAATKASQICELPPNPPTQ